MVVYWVGLQIFSSCPCLYFCLAKLAREASVHKNAVACFLMQVFEKKNTIFCAVLDNVLFHSCRLCLKSEGLSWSLNLHMLQNTPSICHLLACKDRCEVPGLSKRLKAGFIFSFSDATACSFCCKCVMQVTGNDMWACASAYHQTRIDRQDPFLTLVRLAALHPAGAHLSVRSLHLSALQVLVHGRFDWSYFPVSAAAAQKSVVTHDSMYFYF